MYFHLLLQYSGEFYMRNTGMLFPCELNMIITLLKIITYHIYKLSTHSLEKNVCTDTDKQTLTQMHPDDKIPV